MSTWEKVKFYYSSMLNSDGAVVAASSTESTGDYDVAYLSNHLEINSWKAASSATTTIAYTANGQLTNGDFETGDLTGWAGVQVAAGVLTSTTIVSSAPWAGTYNVRLDISNVGAAYQDIRLWHPTQITGIKKGRVYKLLYACKAQASATIQLVLRGFYTRAGLLIYLDGTQPTQAVTTSWVHYEHTFTAVQDMDDLSLRFYIGNGADWYEFDDIVFIEEEGCCADYVLVHGHNLSPDFMVEVAPTLKLEYSDDNASWTAVDVALDGDYAQMLGTLLWEFTKTDGHKYWKWSTISPGNTTEIILLQWGLKTELDYASVSFDPHAQRHKANVNVSYGGYVTGIHEQFIERRMSLKFTDADTALYGKIKTWIDTNGLKNFFVAWELANNATEVFLMRPEPNFDNPLTNGGAYRDINISLLGRKE